MYSILTDFQSILARNAEAVSSLSLSASDKPNSCEIDLCHVLLSPLVLMNISEHAKNSEQPGKHACNS